MTLRAGLREMLLVMSGLGAPVAWADALQQRHSVLAFPVAVMKRYVEDRGAWLGAVISYYGLFSLIPFLLAFVSIVHIVFEPTPSLLQEMLDALWTRLPFVGGQLRGGIEPVQGDPIVVFVALLVALWGAFGVVRVLQHALNQMWGVPRYRRPGILHQLARGLVLLGMAVVALVATTIATLVIVGHGSNAMASIGTAALNLAVNFAVILSLYRILTARRLTARDIAPGALICAAGITVLTIAGGFYVDRVIARTTALYGSFAAVVGLFAWVSLAVQVLVISNLINVVRVERLWPRSLTAERLSDGDLRAVAFTEGRELLVARSRLGSRQPPSAA